MVGKTEGITKRHRARFDALQRLGCICCRAVGHYHRQVQIHHLVQAGKRLGHDATIGLCPWHHQGHPVFGEADKRLSERYFGPSLALNKKSFVNVFGSEQELLEKTNLKLRELGWNGTDNRFDKSALPTNSEYLLEELPGQDDPVEEGDAVQG